jgi:hypothetical protein
MTSSDPLPELRLWERISILAGYIRQQTLKLTKGQAGDSRIKIKQDIREAKELLEKLTDQVCQLFNVVRPKDCPDIEPGKKPPPAGKVWFWDWYDQMRSTYYRSVYEDTVCSACPFCLGLEEMKKKNGAILCQVSSGPFTFHRIGSPHLCSRVVQGFWTEEELYKQIFARHGNQALNKFRKKAKELRVQAQKQKP